MKKKTKVYIVLQTSNIGGAEKRFLELWCYFQMQERKNIFLVINQVLFNIAIQIDSLSLLKTNNNIIVLENKSERYKEFIYKLLPIIMNAPKNSIFHYPLMGTPFIHSFFRHKMIISMVNSTYFERYGTVSFKGKILFRLNSIFAHKIDILNPKIYNKFKQQYFFRQKYFLTTGSMVKTPDKTPNKILNKRENIIVFLGRFIENDPKNVFNYTKSIPIIDAYLTHRLIMNTQYYILGHGSLENELKDILFSKAYEKIEVKCYFESNPMHIMQKSKVMLSLQKYENYPSRSVIEAMSQGVIPIITEVGESLLFENEEIIKYINKDFTSLELAENIFDILNLSEEEYASNSLSLKKFVREKHSIESHAKYYLKLYGICDAG